MIINALYERYSALIYHTCLFFIFPSGVVPHSSRRFLAPLLQVSAPDLTPVAENRMLMMDTRRVDAICSIAMDRVLDCAAERKYFNESCVMLTTIPDTSASRKDPCAYVIKPIYAADDPRNVRGFCHRYFVFPRFAVRARSTS